MKFPQLTKLNFSGIAHYLMPLLVVIVVGAVGTVVFEASHADSAPKTVTIACSGVSDNVNTISTGKNVTFYLKLSNKGNVAATNVGAALYGYSSNGVKTQINGVKFGTLNAGTSSSYALTTSIPKGTVRVTYPTVYFGGPTGAKLTNTCAVRSWAVH